MKFVILMAVKQPVLSNTTVSGGSKHWVISFSKKLVKTFEVELSVSAAIGQPLRFSTKINVNFFLALEVRSGLTKSNDYASKMFASVKFKVI